VNELLKSGNLIIFTLIYLSSIVLWFRYAHISPKQKIQKFIIHIVVFLVLASTMFLLLTNTKDSFWTFVYVAYGMSSMGIWILVSWFVMLFDIARETK
jgi:hypothetical protein